MVICGIKLSHDAGIALIEDDRVLFSIEVEKLENNPRYSSMGGLGRVARMLEAEGLKTSDVDQFVVDGWFVAGVAATEGPDPASPPGAGSTTPRCETPRRPGRQAGAAWAFRSRPTRIVQAQGSRSRAISSGTTCSARRPSASPRTSCARSTSSWDPPSRPTRPRRTARRPVPEPLPRSLPNSGRGGGLQAGRQAL